MCSGLVVLVVLRRPSIALGVRLLTEVEFSFLRAPVVCDRLNLALRWSLWSRRVVSRYGGLLAELGSNFIPRERRMGARPFELSRVLVTPPGACHA